ILEEFTGPQRVEVLRPQIAYLITSILTDSNARSMLFGSNDPLELGRPAAAKTGTTENNQDLWTVGYTPDLVAGVWVGNSDNDPIAPVLSSLTAAPIWHDFMEEIHAGTPVRQFEEPPGIEKATVCAVSGLRPNKYCTHKTTDVFIKGSVPTKECDIHRMVTVDKTTGHLATMLTPPENRENRVIEVYPPEWAEWAKAAGKAGAPQPPSEPEQPAQPVSSQDDNSTLVIASPTAGSTMRSGPLEIRGTASGKSFASYKVEYGEGLAPTEWKPIGGEHNTPVDNNVLERWDPGPLNGPVKIRVTLNHKAEPAPTQVPEPQPGPGTPGPAPTAVPAPPPAPAPPKTVEVTIIVDNQPPTVAITTPSNDTTVQPDRAGKIAISAQVSDNHRVAKTDIYVDNQIIGSSTSVPAASAEWTAVPGTHVIFAITKDAAGNEARSKDVKITVK
ncbi:MAG: Ig-like domain-containing protein, partial [Chloroflexota bacterium]